MVLFVDLSRIGLPSCNAIFCIGKQVIEIAVKQKQRRKMRKKEIDRKKNGKEIEQEIKIFQRI